MPKKFVFSSNQSLPILWSSLSNSSELKTLIIDFLQQKKIPDFLALVSSINLKLNAFLPHRFGLIAKTPEEFKKYDIDLMQYLYTSTVKSNEESAARYVASFAVGYALSEVWRSFGIVPDKVLGHSDGEYTAAVVSGILSLHDAIFLIAQRLKLIENKTIAGSMLAVLCNTTKVKEIIAEFNAENSASTVTLAVINSSEDNVIAGSENDILKLKQKFELNNIKTHALEIIRRGFHSNLMEPIITEFNDVANKVTYNPANITFISSLEAKPVTNITAQYWGKHISDPVNFQSAVHALLQEHEPQSLCFLELKSCVKITCLSLKNYFVGFIV